MTGPPFAAVRVSLQAELPRLLPALGIHERPRGGLVTPRNPTRDDRRPGSFVIWTSGDVGGGWTDYATGEKGDVIDLIAYLLRLRGRMDAYHWALDFLGVAGGERWRSADRRQVDVERQARERAAREAKAAAEAREKAGRLFAHWSRLAPIAGSVAERYLVEARGIPLSALGRPPKALRFDPCAQHVDGETGEVTAWPCLVAAMTRDSIFAGVHRTWLARDGLGKAPVTAPKKMAGAIKGAAIRLSFGASNLRPSAAVKAARITPLAIGEGIETCLTVACARPDLRVWAAGSLSGMAAIAWPACASAVVLLADNDAGEGARAAFDRAEAAWRAVAKGRPVHVARSREGSDFNDWATAA